MKKLQYILLAVNLCLISCASGNKEEAKKQEIIKNSTPGTVIAADSMPVVEDDLNDFQFSVQVLTTTKSNKGAYDVKAMWGYNEATSGFVMPKGGADLVPVIRRNNAPYTYDIGFYYKDDTAFYDYYQVSGERGMIRMKYLKAYSFE